MSRVWKALLWPWTRRRAWRWCGTRCSSLTRRSSKHRRYCGSYSLQERRAVFTAISFNCGSRVTWSLIFNTASNHSFIYFYFYWYVQALLVSKWIPQYLCRNRVIQWHNMVYIHSHERFIMCYKLGILTACNVTKAQSVPILYFIGTKN